jgi:hypothetical protein
MVRVLISTATVAAFGLASAPAAFAQSVVPAVGMLPGVAPAASASRVDAPCTAWGVGNSCYYPNCTAAHKAGEGNIPSTSPHYCPEQNRDNDDHACDL